MYLYIDILEYQSKPTKVFCHWPCFAADSHLGYLLSSMFSTSVHISLSYRLHSLLRSFVYLRPDCIVIVATVGGAVLLVTFKCGDAEHRCLACRVLVFFQWWYCFQVRSIIPCPLGDWCVVLRQLLGAWQAKFCCFLSYFCPFLYIVCSVFYAKSCQIGLIYGL